MPVRTAPALSREQRDALHCLLEFSAPIQTLGGYAGTGKTTLIRELKKCLPRFAVCAYTGKAANVLRRKGVPASTIHSLIYKPDTVMRRTPEGKPYFACEFRLKQPDELGFDGIIIDEASMVDEAVYADLQTFDLPLIFVGDHGQLPPVRGSLNLMENPQLTLETVHRNAGPIAQFVDFIRRGNLAHEWRTRRGCRSGCQVQVTPANDVDWSDALAADQIICAFNTTRVILNRNIRHDYGYPPDQPVVGDRVICLENNRIFGVFNGMQGTVAALGDNDSMRFHADGRDHNLRYYPDQFNSQQKIERSRQRGRVPFDYAYCVTCHKAQGDEWNSVVVLEQYCRAWDHARWAYTAASRARKLLVWATP